jgi:fructosamine-3-kinase
MNAGVRTDVAAALGADVLDARPIGGGDINDAYAVSLGDGRLVFVKTNARAPADMFAAEARGLAWLAEAGALRVPDVLAAGERFLALELLRAARPAADYDERFGRGLAALHGFGADSFGLDHDNYIGRLPQANDPPDDPADDWCAFYRERRLEPQLRAAVDAGHIRAPLRRRFDDLLARLEDLVGPGEPPARLHGDLWGGNKHVDDAGGPCIIDPAAYGGHREIDLAMMQLFGGFGARVFEAYDEAQPLAPGWRERVPLYQLYPILVHVNLFGGGYVGSAESALDRIG